MPLVADLRHVRKIDNDIGAQPNANSTVRCMQGKFVGRSSGPVAAFAARPRHFECGASLGAFVRKT
jgi:hypothetical protein